MKRNKNLYSSFTHNSKEIMDVLRIKRYSTLTRYRKYGLPYIKIGGRLYYNKEQSIKWKQSYYKLSNSYWYP